MRQLSDRISRILDDQFVGDGHWEAFVPGLILMRSYSRMPPFHMLYRPTLCVVAQGAKEVMIADRTVRYGGGQTMVVTIEAPVLSQVVEASAAKPYIGAILELDLGIILEVAAQLGHGPKTTGGIGLGFEVHELDARLVGAMMRLLALVDDAGAMKILYPSIQREIAYWLIQGAAGRSILRMAAPHGRAQRIARAMTFLREHFDVTVNVGALARAAGMSASTFHQNFKALTGMSPLQYQKHVRLLEARRQMLSGDVQAGAVAAGVGYESVSQFSREYARMFGSPPRRETRAPSLARGR